MKDQFDNWIYVPAESFATTPVTITENKDGVFIFDQHISHSEFDRFRDYMDKHGISYGYLKNVNQIQAILQIYEKIR